MKKSKFESYLKHTLEDETPDVLSKIKQDPRFYIPQKKAFSLRTMFKENKVSYLFSSIFVLGLFILAIMFSQSPTNEVVASTITIDINPSVELLLDEEDNIIEVRAINTDAEMLIQNKARFKGLNIDTAIRYLIQEAINRGIIEDTETSILVNVSSETTERKSLVQEKLEAAFRRESMRHNQPFDVHNMVRELTENVREQAENRHMTGAKYQLIQAILESTDIYSFEDLQDQSIRDLFRILNEENADNQDFPPMGPRDDMPGHNMPGRNN